MADETSTPRPKVRRPGGRPVRVLDLMALVAAVALTLITPTIMKAIIPAKSHHNWDRRQYVVHLASLGLFWWTASLTSLIVVESWPHFRRTFRQRGPAALFAVVAAFVFIGLEQVAWALVLGGVVGWRPGMVKYYWLFNILERGGSAAGASVFAVWLLLAVTKAGRGPSNWLDRAGCAVGLIWIFWGLVNNMVYWLPIPWLTRSGIA
jgi:hypothetical protein